MRGKLSGVRANRRGGWNGAIVVERQHLQEGIHHSRVELGTPAAAEFILCCFGVHRNLVWAVRSHRNVGVDDGDDPCGQRYSLAAQTVRITGPVELLVVMSHCGFRETCRCRVREHVRSEERRVGKECRL